MSSFQCPCCKTVSRWRTNRLQDFVRICCTPTFRIRSVIRSSLADARTLTSRWWALRFFTSCRNVVCSVFPRLSPGMYSMLLETGPVRFCNLSPNQPDWMGWTFPKLIPVLWNSLNHLGPALLFSHFHRPELWFQLRKLPSASTLKYCNCGSKEPEKNLLSSNISSRCRHNMVNFGLLPAEIGPVVWGNPANLNLFRVLAALLHGTLVVGVSQTLRRWTEGATYIRQGGHHVGHWPTF